MNILITGGNGYIGSHTVTTLREHYPDAQLIIADNLTNSSSESFERLTEILGEDILFYNIDLCEEYTLERLFQHYTFDAVFHFAGYKAVGESVLNPLKYYRNNIMSTINLVTLCLQYHVHQFIFSSSATVYGNAHSPMKETDVPLPPSNPYGDTKAICERILISVAEAHPEFNVAILRYFNPVGAHSSGLIGEVPEGIPNNLMPYLTKVAKKELPYVQVFGNDYPTLDGTGVRDYIHIMDLAEGHVAALKQLRPGAQIFNLGTGVGTSVLQLIHTFEKVNGITIPYQIVDRRPGDVATMYADVQKAQQQLNWQATRTLEDMCRDVWLFEKQHSIF